MTQRIIRRGLVWLICAGGMCIVGCSSPQTTNTPGTEKEADAKETNATGKLTKVGIVFDVGGLGDKSFNDSAKRGVDRAAKELGVEILQVESTRQSDYETNLSSMADQGAQVVIAVGIDMGTPLKVVAPQYPDVNFVGIDIDLPEVKNVRSIQFKEEEGSYLVGYLAGLMTKSNKIGFVGGKDMPLIRKFQYGYMAGAHDANPAVEVLPAKFTGDWVNQDTAKVAANLLYGSGADIVYHAAGLAGLGVLGAAKDQKKWAIGVDSDQDYVAPGNVLTSMIKRVDEAVFQTLKQASEGSFTPGSAIFDLKMDGVGTSEFKYSKTEIGPEKLAKLDEARKRLLDGTVTAPKDEESYKAHIAQQH